MFIGSLINDDLVWARLENHTGINANDWNAAYKSEIIDHQRRNRSRDPEVVMASLIDDGGD